MKKAKLKKIEREKQLRENLVNEIKYLRDERKYSWREIAEVVERSHEGVRHIYLKHTT